MRHVSYPLAQPYTSYTRILNVITDFVNIYVLNLICAYLLNFNAFSIQYLAKNEVHCSACAKFLATETCYHGNNYQEVGYILLFWSIIRAYTNQ